jgi:hypothetical protein
VTPKHGPLPESHPGCTFLVTIGDIDWWFGPSVFGEDLPGDLFYLNRSDYHVTYIRPEAMTREGYRTPRLIRAIAYSIAKDKGLL